MIEKNWDPKKRYEILVQHFRGGPTLSIYSGPWIPAADTQWLKAGMFYATRRIRRDVQDIEVQAMFYGHPDLVALEKHLDDFYAVPGEGEPNRTADPEIMSAVRRQVPPFDARAESFYPEGFAFEPAEAVDTEAA